MITLGLKISLKLRLVLVARIDLCLLGDIVRLCVCKEWDDTDLVLFIPIISYLSVGNLTYVYLCVGSGLCLTLVCVEDEIHGLACGWDVLILSELFKFSA